jgi:hypothetical protein
MHAVAIHHRIFNLPENRGNSKMHIESLTIDMAPLHALSSRLMQGVDSDAPQHVHKLCNTKMDLVRSGKGPQGSVLNCTSHRTVHDGVACLSIIGSRAEWCGALLEILEPGEGNEEQPVDGLGSYFQDTLYNVAISLCSL